METITIVPPLHRRTCNILGNNTSPACRSRMVRVPVVSQHMQWFMVEGAFADR